MSTTWSHLGVMKCGVAEINGVFYRVEDEKKIQALFNVDIDYERQQISSFALPRVVFHRKCDSTDYVFARLIPSHIYHSFNDDDATPLWYAIRLAPLKSGQQSDKIRMKDHTIMYIHNELNAHDIHEKPPSRGWIPVAGTTPAPVLVGMSQQLHMENSDAKTSVCVMYFNICMRKHTYIKRLYEHAKLRTRDHFFLGGGVKKKKKGKTVQLDTIPEEKKSTENQLITQKPETQNADKAKNKKWKVDDVLCQDINMIGSDQILRVTSKIDVLQTKWKESQLGPHDCLEVFLNCVGRVVDMDDSDDSVKLEWADLTSNWLPYKACFLTWSKDVTTPDYSKDKESECADIEYDKNLLEGIKQLFVLARFVTSSFFSKIYYLIFQFSLFFQFLVLSLHSKNILQQYQTNISYFAYREILFLQFFQTSNILPTFYNQKSWFFVIITTRKNEKKKKGAKLISRSSNLGYFFNRVYLTQVKKKNEHFHKSNYKLVLYLDKSKKLLFDYELALSSMWSLGCFSL
ncbi:hypothetical protein RFI_40101, partial [Reticulomyxa filosa]